MVRIGVAGIGFMGMIHYLAWQRVAPAKVVAISSRDPVKLSGDWRGIRGNFGPPGEIMNLAAVQKYDDYATMLADPDIDLVDVCNPTHLHPEFAIAALKAGKHVLVEKAIALTAADADAMLAAAKAAGKLLMVAHVLPFFPEFAYAADAVRSGKQGKLLAAHFNRVIAAPDWSADIGDAAKTGGPAVDLHIHDTHFIGLIAGVPTAVRSVGVEAGGAVNYVSTIYDYGPGGPAITCTSGATAMPGRPFVHGFDIYLERATLTHSSAGIPLTVYPKVGGGFVPELGGGGDPIAAFADELSAAADAVRTGEPHALLDGQLARDALVLCHRECESVRTGSAVAAK